MLPKSVPYGKTPTHTQVYMPARDAASGPHCLCGNFETKLFCLHDAGILSQLIFQPQITSINCPYKAKLSLPQILTLIPSETSQAQPP